MDRHDNKPFEPWSSKMVAKVDVTFRSLVPVVPNAIEIPNINRLLSDLEYDFILERQVVSDHDQYWDQKRRLEAASPKPKPKPPPPAHPPTVVVEKSSSPTHDAKSVQCPPDMTTNCVDQWHCSQPSSTIATVSRQTLTAGTTTAPSFVDQHLLAGTVLQPMRTSAHRGQSEVGPLTAHHQPPDPHLSTQRVVANRLSLLHDFETGPDDPFSTVELNTINDLEELRRVSVASQLPNTTNIRQQQVAKRDSSQPPPTPVAGLSNKSLGKPHGPVSESPRKDGHCLSIRPASSTSSAHSLTMSRRKSLSSSVPNLKGSTPAVGRTSSMTVTNGHYPPQGSTSSTGLNPRQTPPPPPSRLGGHLPRPMGPLPPPPHQSLPPGTTTGSSHPVTPLGSGERGSELIAWAVKHGLSVTRTHCLLRVPQNQLRYHSLPLEEAKRRLGEQSRLVDLLLGEFAPPHYATRLSEQSAIAAATAFLHDPTKARQFAKVTLDMEAIGYTQERTQSFLLDAKQSHEDTLVHLLANHASLSSTEEQRTRKSVWPSDPCTR